MSVSTNNNKLPNSFGITGRYDPLGGTLLKSRMKTANPLDPRQQFCQYWPRECNLTTDFWVCWVFAPSNQPIRELGPLAGVYQQISLWVCWVSPANQRDGSALATSVGLEANPTSQTVAIASPWVQGINCLRLLSTLRSFQNRAM